MLNDINGHKLLIERLMIAINSGKSLIIQGPNGVGKTSAVYEVAEKLGRHVQTHLGPSTTPETFGMNVPDKSFNEYRFVWNERFMSAPEGTIHLIDEFGHTPPAVQALLGEPVLSGTVQGKKMPKGSVFVLTANRVGDTAGTHAISRLINTRCPTVTYYGPTDQEYLGDDKSPGYMRIHGHPAVTTALEYNTELIHFMRGSYAEIERKQDKLPTHRGWVECSAELKTAEELLHKGIITSVNRMAIISSHVGDKAAAKCEAIVRLWQELPDFSGMTSAEIGKMDVPDNAVVRSLIINQIVAAGKEAVIAKLDPLISRFPAEEQKVMWVQLIAKSIHFTSTSAYKSFAVVLASISTTNKEKVMKNLGIDENVENMEVTPLEVGDPNIGDSIWIDTDRFFYIGRFRGRSRDGQFWIIDKASLVLQMGVYDGCHYSRR